jgi:hypothetical protein
MYYVIVIATTLVLPIGAAVADLLLSTKGALGAGGDVLPPLGLLLTGYLGKWYVFFAVGVRLFLTGLRQTFTPGFTLKEIFEIDHKPSEHIVQELGFANLSMGMLGLLALLDPMLTLAGAVTGGLYYGLAGFKHISKGNRNTMRTMAMITDILVFCVLAAYVTLAVRQMLT